MSRIWTVVETRAASLLPPATATHPQLVHGPGIVVHLRGEQRITARYADAFPYDGRAGSGHVVVGGVLWRPVDRDALTSIATAWRRAESIARTFWQLTRAGDPQLLPLGPAAAADDSHPPQLSTFGDRILTGRAAADTITPATPPREGTPHVPRHHHRGPGPAHSHRPRRPRRPPPRPAPRRRCPVQIDWTITRPDGHPVRGCAGTAGHDPMVEANLNAQHHGLVDDFAMALYEASRHPTP